MAQFTLQIDPFSGPVIASVLSVQGIEALVGRDILDRCLLIYNGSEGRFTFAF